MQSHAQCQWCHRVRPKALLAHGQTSAEFERHAHRPPRIVFVSHRDPKHGHEALAHHRMEPPPVLAHHVLGKSMECEQ
jgi:hypothetical protein